MSKALSRMSTQLGNEKSSEMNYVEFGTFQRKIKLDRHFTIFSVGHLGYLRHIKYNNWIYENDNSVISWPMFVTFFGLWFE